MLSLLRIAQIQPENRTKPQERRCNGLNVLEHRDRYHDSSKILYDPNYHTSLVSIVSTKIPASPAS